MSDDEETYSTIFTALRHPLRRRILRMLAKEPMSFTEMLNRLEIESPHLTYHLESLGVLTAKTESGQYRLSTFGRAAVATMGWVEEAPKTEPQPTPVPTRWKAVVVVLVIGVVMLAGAYYQQSQALSGLHTAYDGLYVEYTGLSADWDHLRADYDMVLDELLGERLRALDELQAQPFTSLSVLWKVDFITKYSYVYVEDLEYVRAHIDDIVYRLERNDTFMDLVNTYGGTWEPVKRSSGALRMGINLLDKTYLLIVNIRADGDEGRDVVRDCTIVLSPSLKVVDIWDGAIYLPWSAIPNE
jgi:DNA-binding transcriptional ArsR family regulator